MPSDSLTRAEASIQLAVQSWPTVAETLAASLDQLSKIDRASLNPDDLAKLGILREQLVILRAKAKQGLTLHAGLEQLDAVVGYTPAGLEWARRI